MIKWGSSKSITKLIVLDQSALNYEVNAAINLGMITNLKKKILIVSSFYDLFVKETTQIYNTSSLYTKSSI